MSQERNRRAFENKENSAHSIKFNFLYNLWAWSYVFMFHDPSTIVDFVDLFGLGWFVLGGRLIF